MKQSMVSKKHHPLMEQMVMFNLPSAEYVETFKNFKNMMYLKSPIKIINLYVADWYFFKYTESLSQQSTTLLLDFENDGKTTSNVMKVSRDYNKSRSGRASDNMYYEAFVGSFVNQLASRFPTFTVTNGFFKLTPELQKQINVCSQDMIDPENVNKRQFSKEITQLPFQSPEDFINGDISDSCKSYELYGITTPYFKNSVQFNEFLTSKLIVSNITQIMESSSSSFFSYELLNIMFQVYSCLSVNAKVFTHYDLDSRNILIQELPDGKYVRMSYHYENGETVSFNTNLFVKMIDYSLSYTSFTPQFLERLCDKDYSPECNNSRTNVCGKKNGYAYLTNESKHTNFSTSKTKTSAKGDSFENRDKIFSPDVINVDSSVNNVSYDLMFAYGVYTQIKHRLPPSLTQDVLDSKFCGLEVLSKVFYGNNVYYDFGTRRQRYNSHEGKAIVNVMQMEEALHAFMRIDKTYNEHKKKYDNEVSQSNLIGHLHMFMTENRPMEFTAV